MIEIFVALGAIMVFVGVVMLVDRYQKKHLHKSLH